MVNRNSRASAPDVANAAPTEDRRAQIIRVSAELFAQEGYANTTVRMIAARTGLLSGSLYHHFDSKDAILEEILRAYIFELVETVQGVVDETAADPLLGLRRLILATTKTIEHHGAAIRILQNEIATKFLQDARFGYLIKQGDVITGAWTGVLKTGVAKGVFNPDIDPELVYRFVRDTIWVVARWYRPGSRYTLDMIAEK